MNAKNTRQDEKYTVQRSKLEPMATVTIIKILSVNGHALSCTRLVFMHGTETLLDLKWKKLAIYRVWPCISKITERDPNSGPSGLEFIALTHTPTAWAKSLRLSSFTSDWTVPWSGQTWTLKTAEQNEKHTVKLAMATVTSVTFLCKCVYGHALSCAELAFRHATERHLEFQVANKDKERKSWLFTERDLGFQTAGSGTRTRDFRVSSPAL